MLQLTEQNFDKEASKSKIPVLIDFYADWCGPCKMLGPVLEELSKDPVFEGKLKFTKVNTEEYPDIAQNFNISGIPCLIIMKNGQEATRIVGYSPKPVMKKNIEEALKKI